MYLYVNLLRRIDDHTAQTENDFQAIEPDTDEHFGIGFPLNCPLQFDPNGRASIFELKNLETSQ